MKIAYLITAYNNPNHLNRLVQALEFPNCSFFIHIDKKSDLSPFHQIQGNNITYCQNRIEVYWAEYSMVEAIINLIREAYVKPNNFDYFVLLSGSDYPIKSKEYIQSFFEAHRGKEFINIYNMSSKQQDKLLNRLTTYRPRTINLSSRYSKILLRVIRRFLRRDYKKHLGSLETYGGSTWWALTQQACSYIVKFVNSEKRVMKFFENTVCPEEMVFQTILGNSTFRDKIHKNLTFTDWSGGGAHPAPISQNHVELFENNYDITANDGYGEGTILFARKFSDQDGELCAKIDRLIQKKEKKGLTRHCT